MPKSRTRKTRNSRPRAKSSWHAAQGRKPAKLKPESDVPVAVCDAQMAEVNASPAAGVATEVAEVSR